MSDGQLTGEEWEARSFASLVKEWRAGRLPGEGERASLDRLSRVRGELFSRLRTPDSIAMRTPKK